MSKLPAQSDMLQQDRDTQERIRRIEEAWALGKLGGAGITNITGATWRSGAGAPAGGLGAVTDWYLNTTNGDVYEKTGASTWTLRDNLTGPTGAAGAAGPAGSTGAAGSPGLGLPVGGTIGAILAKKSNADYDTDWLTVANARQVQTGGLQSSAGYSNLSASPTPSNTAQRIAFTVVPGTYILRIGMSAWHTAPVSSAYNIYARLPDGSYSTVIAGESYSISTANAHTTLAPISTEITITTAGTLYLWPGIGGLTTDVNDRFDVTLIPKDIVGPQGPAGSGGDLNYVHNQVSPSATWTVTHNLGKFPAVSVIDTGGNMLLPNVTFVDSNTLTISFAGATSGKVYVN